MAYLYKGKAYLKAKLAEKKKRVDLRYKYYEMKGLTKKEIIKIIAHDRNVPKDDIYKKFIDT